nr:zinc finger, RING-CH-type, zinc finger, RING/FYVE/PHD-type [Tanacetum cinerariifolium]
MSIFEVHGSSSSQNEEVVIKVQEEVYKENIEAQNSKQWRKPNLFLEIPSRSILPSSSQEFVQIKMLTTPTPTPKKVNFNLTPTSAEARSLASPATYTPRTKSMKKSFLTKLSFKNRNTVSDTEKAVVNTTPRTPSSVPQEKPSFVRSWSFKIFTPRGKRTASLPVTPVGHSDQEPALGSSRGSLNLEAKVQKYMSRSRSAPNLNKDPSIRRTESFFRVIPSTPRVKEADPTTPTPTQTASIDEDDDDGGEDIPEEEAVCRICFVELCEANDLEINGYGNRNSAAFRANDLEINGYGDLYRVWQEVPILVIVSMLAYFCFLEQLLVGNLGTGAIALSLPFSCVLGLLSSMTSSTMVKKQFIWLYASVQFSFVVLFAHIFYNVIDIHPVLSILLATFAGCGVVMCGSSILVEALRVRRRWLIARSSNQQTDAQASSHADPSHQIDIGNI